MARRLALVILAALLAGCMPARPGVAVGSSRACLAENARFADAWACIKARMSNSSVANRDGFIEEGDLLAAQVRSGKVSEPDARRRLSAGLDHES